MNTEEKHIYTPDTRPSQDDTTNPVEDTSGLEIDNQLENDIIELEEDIIRNDTIPETSKDTPGSNGAFPVGAFDTSKD